MPPSAWTPITRIFAQQFFRPREQAVHSPQVRVSRAIQKARDGRVHRASVAGLERQDTVAGLDDLYRELVPENSWIAEERLRAFERVEIGAADADCQHPHKHFARSWRARLRGISECESARLFKNDCLHRRYVSTVPDRPCFSPRSSDLPHEFSVSCLCQLHHKIKPCGRHLLLEKRSLQ